MVCGSRFLTDDYRYPAPISRRTGIHIFAFLLSRIVGMRVSDPDLRISAVQPQGDRAVRARLPARLSRRWRRCSCSTVIACACARSR